MSHKFKLKAKMGKKRSSLNESDDTTLIQNIRQELHDKDPGRALFYLIKSEQPDARKAILFDYINQNSNGEIIRGFVSEIEKFKFSSVGRAYMKVVDMGSDKEFLGIQFVSISDFGQETSKEVLNAIQETVGAFLEKCMYPFHVELYGASFDDLRFRVSYDFMYDITQKSHREAYKAFEAVFKCCEQFDDICSTISEIIVSEVFRGGYQVSEGIEDRGEEAIGSSLKLDIFKKGKNTYFELTDGPKTYFRIITQPPVPQGQSLGAHHIVSTKAKKGWGALGYEMAMAYHHPRNKKSYALMPDRMTVSNSAEAVWAKYAERADVDHKSVDDVDAWDEMDKRTPDYPFDDTHILEPYDFTSDSREENHYLDRAYRLSDSRAQEILAIMRKLGADV